jgi:hypothetical protein
MPGSQPSVCPRANSAEEREALLVEYSALREEIVKRIEFRYKVFEITLVAAGAIVVAGLQLKQPAPILLTFSILECLSKPVMGGHSSR